jgi:sulfite reductase alpha subunit-like flavoprotein
MIRKLIYSLKGRIYICGSTSMSKEVLSIIQRHVTDEVSKSFSYEEGEKEMDRLLKEKQICMEAWN